MTPSELKAHVEARGDSPFFSRKTMQFFGDTMRNYGIRAVRIRRHCGTEVNAWELYRKRPVKHGLKASAYFCAETFAKIGGDLIGDEHGDNGQTGAL